MKLVAFKQDFKEVDRMEINVEISYLLRDFLEQNISSWNRFVSENKEKYTEQDKQVHFFTDDNLKIDITKYAKANEPKRLFGKFREYIQGMFKRSKV